MQTRTPETRDLHRQANASYCAGRFAESAKLFRQLADGPDPVEGHHGLGVLALQRNDLDAALSHFREALIHAPRHANSLYWLAYLAEARGATFEAFILYQATLANEPQHRAAAKAAKRLTALDASALRSWADPGGTPAPGGLEYPPALVLDGAAASLPPAVAPATSPRDRHKVSPSVGRGVRGQVTDLTPFQQQAWNTGRFKQGFNFRLHTGGGEVVEVEIRGQKIYGRLRNGDDVEVLSGFRRRGLVVAARLYNHSSRSEIRRRII